MRGIEVTITVVSGLHDQFRKVNACGVTSFDLSEVWANILGSQVQLTASGGTGPYLWHFPDGTEQSGDSVTWRLGGRGCVVLTDSQNDRATIYVEVAFELGGPHDA